MSALKPQSISVNTMDYINPVFIILKKLEQQNIISILALALKKNLQNFSLASQNTQVKKQKAEIHSRKATLDEIVENDVIEIPSDQEALPNKESVYLSLANVSTMIGLNNSLKTQKTLEHLPTSSQNHFDLAQNKRKAKIIKKQTREKPCSLKIIIPQIDLVSTAYIRCQKPSRLYFKQLKFNLLSRKVQTWSSKSKTQKRQIRMLGS